MQPCSSSCLQQPTYPLLWWEWWGQQHLGQWARSRAPRYVGGAVIADKVAEAAAALSDFEVKCAVRVQSSLAERAASLPWLTVS